MQTSCRPLAGCGSIVAINSTNGEEKDQGRSLICISSKRLTIVQKITSQLPLINHDPSCIHHHTPRMLCIMSQGVREFNISVSKSTKKQLLAISTTLTRMISAMKNCFFLFSFCQVGLLPAYCLDYLIFGFCLLVTVDPCGVSLTPLIKDNREERKKHEQGDSVIPALCSLAVKGADFPFSHTAKTLQPDSPILE